MLRKLIVYQFASGQVEAPFNSDGDVVDFISEVELKITHLDRVPLTRIHLQLP